MEKRKNEEWWKRNVEKNAEIIAERVAEKGMIITGVNKEAPIGMLKDIEKCLLDKYNIEVLKFEEYPNVHMIIPNISSDKQKELIRKAFKENISEVQNSYETSKAIWRKFGIEIL